VLGAYAWLMQEPTYLRAEWQRFFTSDGGTGAPLDVVTLSGCSVHRIGGNGPFSVCLDFGLYDGGVLLPSSGELVRSTALVWGLSFGIGVINLGATPR
jgi:hypothetical protein